MTNKGKKIPEYYRKCRYDIFFREIQQKKWQLFSIEKSKHMLMVNVYQKSSSFDFSNNEQCCQIYIVAKISVSSNLRKNEHQSSVL